MDITHCLLKALRNLFVRTLAAQSIFMGSSMAGSLTLEPMEGEEWGGGQCILAYHFLNTNS